MTQQPHNSHPSHNGETDQRLQQSLSEAFTSATRNPDFRTRVWQRIEAAEAAPQAWGPWLRRHRIGISCVTALCLCAGLIAGGWLANEQANRQREQQLMHYLASIDAHQRLHVEDNSGSHRR